MSKQELIAALKRMGFSHTEGSDFVIDQDAEVEFSVSETGATVRALSDEYASNAVWVEGSLIMQGYSAVDAFLNSRGL